MAWTYESSKLEKLWLANVKKWQDGYCAQHQKQLDTFVKLQAMVTAVDESPVPNRMAMMLDKDGDMLSRFVHTYECAGGFLYNLTEPIEPLISLLRDPLSWDCPRDHFMNDTILYSRAHLLLGHGNTPHIKAAPKRVYMDVGASVYHDISQSWTLQKYENRSIKFDRHLMWEAIVHSGDSIVKDVPGKYLHAYQYFNMPAASDVNDPKNPLNVLQQIAQPEDYVVYKLDIDNFPIEKSLINQMLSDPLLVSIVDEFFFELHFNYPGMVKCCWGNTADPNVDLAGAYDLFLRMRKLGIRAHGWP